MMTACWVAVLLVARLASAYQQHSNGWRASPPHANKTQKQKNDLLSKIVLVGLPGFEPRMTGPESVVLPLHHSPIFVFDDAKVE